MAGVGAFGWGGLPEFGRLRHHLPGGPQLPPGYRSDLVPNATDIQPKFHNTVYQALVD